MNEEHRNRPVFLVGFMGSGKSTVGRLVAAKMGRPFLDSDRMIEAAAGRTIRELFDADGEDAFRALERKVAARIADMENVVVSMGGGAFEDPGIRERLQSSGVVIWLDAPLETIRARLGVNSSRPLWPKGREEQEKMFRNRRKALSLVPYQVDAGDRPPEAIATEVLSLIGSEKTWEA